MRVRIKTVLRNNIQLQFGKRLLNYCKHLLVEQWPELDKTSDTSLKGTRTFLANRLVFALMFEEQTSRKNLKDLKEKLLEKAANPERGKDIFEALQEQVKKLRKELPSPLLRKDEEGKPKRTDAFKSKWWLLVPWLFLVQNKQLEKLEQTKLEWKQRQLQAEEKKEKQESRQWTTPWCSNKQFSISCAPSFDATYFTLGKLPLLGIVNKLPMWQRTMLIVKAMLRYLFEEAPRPWMEMDCHIVQQLVDRYEELKWEQPELAHNFQRAIRVRWDDVWKVIPFVDIFDLLLQTSIWRDVKPKKQKQEKSEKKEKKRQEHRWLTLIPAEDQKRMHGYLDLEKKHNQAMDNRDQRTADKLLRRIQTMKEGDRQQPYGVIEQLLFFRENRSSVMEDRLRELALVTIGVSNPAMESSEDTSIARSLQFAIFHLDRMKHREGTQLQLADLRTDGVTLDTVWINPCEEHPDAVAEEESCSQALLTGSESRHRTAKEHWPDEKEVMRTLCFHWLSLSELTFFFVAGG